MLMQRARTPLTAAAAVVLRQLSFPHRPKLHSASSPTTPSGTSYRSTSNAMPREQTLRPTITRGRREYVRQNPTAVGRIFNFWEGDGVEIGAAVQYRTD